MLRARKALTHAVPALAQPVAVRADLRTGAVAAGVVSAPLDGPQDLWMETLLDAHKAWTAAGFAAPISITAPRISISDPDCAGVLDAALRAADFPMRSVTLEIDEHDLVEGGNDAMQALERLRARGWGVALHSAPDCPMPMGSRARSVFTDVLVDTPDDLTPFLGLAGYDESAMARRVWAAAAAGLTVTAKNVLSLAHAGILIAAGFDRGEGPAFAPRTLHA